MKGNMKRDDGIEIEVDRDDLQSTLAMAKSVINRTLVQPVLANVLLRAADDEIECCATDTTVWVRASLPGKVSGCGSLTLDASILHNIVRTLPPGKIEIRALENSWGQLRTEGSEIRLMGLPEGDYPDVPDAGTVRFVELESSQIAELIEKTLFSVCSDPARQNVYGALLETENGTVTMVSTDGHRLTKLSMKIPGLSLEQSIIIPRRGLQEIRAALVRNGGICKVGVQSGKMFVETGTLTFAVALTQATFPPWREMLQTLPRRATIHRRALVERLRQAVVLAPEKTAAVRVTIEKGQLELHAENPTRGSINLSLAAEHDGKRFEACFNATYMLEALSAIDSEYIFLDFDKTLAPAAMRPVAENVDFVAVVMPMRIGGTGS